MTKSLTCRALRRSSLGLLSSLGLRRSPFASLFLAVAYLASLSASAAEKRPNILFLAVDDLKPVLGCYGDKVVKSPNIVRLAARGVVFERAYCNQAVCAPSRNSLMTGVRPTSLGIYDLGTNFRQAAPDAVTLPQYFMRHGYRTEALGKIFHVGHGNHEDPASWSVPHFQSKSIAYMLPQSRSNQTLTREEALFANNTDVAKLPRGAAYESADVPDSAYPDGKIADEAIRRLQNAEAKPSEPFFLAIGFLKPHLPFCAPKKYWDLYERAAFTVPSLRTPPEGAPKYAPTGWGELRQYGDIPETGPLTDGQARTMIHGYHAAVSYLDAQIGRVLDELGRLGLASNTVVVLWGDHGWHLGDHGMWSKHTNYEQATRIPLIVAAPGTTRPGTHAVNALVETVDLYPTLAELAGLPAPRVPQGVDGKSFLAVLRDPTLSMKDCIFHVFPRGERIGRAVRTARHRLVEWKASGASGDTADLELYDYVADPLETSNLAPAQPGVVSRMRAMLDRLPEAKAQIKAPKSAAKQAADRPALFKRKDRNNDGQLTRGEFMEGQPDPEPAAGRFLLFDTNKDGKLSEREFVGQGKP